MDSFVRTLVGAPVAAVLVLAPAPASSQIHERSWLAGDHHVHSRRSEDYNEATNPPTPIAGTDAEYPILLNALRAREYGLSWMVSTDHGGPFHSTYNLEETYPEIVQARAEVPEVLLFYGMEFDTPGANHTSLIIPKVPDEDSLLYEIESRFAEDDAWPEEDVRSTEQHMLDALAWMQARPVKPLTFTNHPSRSADGLGVWGANEPHEFRAWNDIAPEVAVGMEGAPGHQGRLKRDGSPRTDGDRGNYGNYPTHGGVDQVTAVVGGMWDALLGEGRRWWITATSDSHRNWREGGGDFWPGEYSKTWVRAARTHEDVMDGLRRGRSFITFGDLITEMELRVDVEGGGSAGLGGSTRLPAHGSDVTITVRVRDPEAPNQRGHRVAPARIDLIVGEIHGPAADRSSDRNPTTRVVRRFIETDWTRKGEILTMAHVLEDVTSPIYVRIRGTADAAQLEPDPDPIGEDPWQDLWFYSNPVFVERR
jgi:hypothetical protein